MANKHKKKPKKNDIEIPAELKEELRKATISYLNTKGKWRKKEENFK